MSHVVGLCECTRTLSIKFLELFVSCCCALNLVTS